LVANKQQLPLCWDPTGTYQTNCPGPGQVNCFFGGQCAFVPTIVKWFCAVFSCDEGGGVQGYDPAGIARALADTVGGEVIEYDQGVAHLSFPSSAGQLQAAFEISIEGDTLHLKQFVLYPLDDSQKLAVGPTQLLGFVGHIKGVAQPRVHQASYHGDPADGRKPRQCDRSHV
jgi:hypothetical protein